jgi:hypothetical protein
LVQEIGIPGENHKSHWQTLSHIVPCIPRHERYSNS